MDSNVKIWQEELRQAANPGKIGILSSFFKTGKGEYGEGDLFIGLTVPLNRSISRKYHNEPHEALSAMLTSPIHEFRLAALLALVERARKAKTDVVRHKAIADFYLAHTDHINNWDLVDLSAPQIIGEYMVAAGSCEIAYRLARSSRMWEQRIGIVSTFTLIKHGHFDATLRIAEQLLTHRHDLIHKATGWMLREVGKRDEATLAAFLDAHCTSMPRTALRYAVERLDPTTRKHYMTKRSND